MSAPNSLRRRMRCVTPPCFTHGVSPPPANVPAPADNEFCRWCSDALPSEICAALASTPRLCCTPGDYHYTNGEAFANFLTHSLCIPGAAYVFYELLSSTNTTRETFVLSIYGSLLMALFLVSTLYHFVFMLEVWHSSLFFGPWRQFMLMMDRSTVHLFIAGCYTPWLVLRDHGPLGKIGHVSEGDAIIFSVISILGMYMCQAMWIATFSGIIIQHSKLVVDYVHLIILYLFIGILPGTFMIVCATNSNGLLMVGLGGLAYLTGLLFFFCDGYIPYAHAIWHCFVNVGVYLHYRALSDYLLRERLDEHLAATSVTGRLYAAIADMWSAINL